MRKMYTPGYIPSRTMQHKLLEETQCAISNRSERSLTASRNIQRVTTTSSVLVAGLMLSTIIFPLVTRAQTTESSEEGNASSGVGSRGHVHQNVHNSTNGRSEVYEKTGCSLLLDSLSSEGTSVNAECLLVPSNSTEQSMLLRVAFGNTTVPNTTEPNCVGVGYQSSRLMEVCLDKNAAAKIQNSSLCSDSAVDPMKTDGGTQELYDEHLPQVGSGPVKSSLVCSTLEKNSISVSQINVLEETRETNCRPLTEEERLRAYIHPYPKQDNSTVSNHTCPSEVKLISDGVYSQSGMNVSSTCIPVSVRQAGSFCTNNDVEINKSCSEGMYTNAKDCIMGSEAAGVFKRACPDITISDVRAVYHQATGNMNTTIPIMPITTLVQSLDLVLEGGGNVPYVYITHPGTPIKTNRHSTKLLQGYIDKLQQKGCSIILDTGNGSLPQNDIFSQVKNITIVKSVKEALERGFLRDFVRTTTGGTTETSSSTSGTTTGGTTETSSSTSGTTTGGTTETSSSTSGTEEASAVSMEFFAALLGSLTLAGSILLCSLNKKRKKKEEVKDSEEVLLEDIPSNSRGSLERRASIHLVPSLLPRSEEDSRIEEETPFNTDIPSSGEVQNQHFTIPEEGVGSSTALLRGSEIQNRVAFASVEEIALRPLRSEHRHLKLDISPGNYPRTRQHKAQGAECSERVHLTQPIKREYVERRKRGVRHYHVPDKQAKNKESDHDS
ncbi:MAG: hypothetical protein ACRCV3_00545 [Desulfovibrionaceae bacterium]